MYKVMWLIVFRALAMACVLNYGEAQTVHAVGDTAGWTVPSHGGAAAYSNWASANAFKVGDILVFNFATGKHDVVQVSKDSFDACTATNAAIGASFTDGPAHVTLNSTGDHYYICTIKNHCMLGQKLSINVSADYCNSTTPPVASPPLPPPTSSPPVPAPIPSSSIPGPSGSTSPPTSVAPVGPSGSIAPSDVATDSPKSRASLVAEHASLTLTLACIIMAVVYVYP